MQEQKRKTNAGDENYCLRIYVDAGGCSGFQYNFQMILEDEVDKKQDYIFEQNNLKVVVDEITMDMVNKCTVDFKEEMMRSSFEIIANPNAELGCSCGTSFSLK